MSKADETTATQNFWMYVRLAGERAAKNRVNKLFYEKLRAQEPDHPWLKTERAKKALGE